MTRSYLTALAVGFTIAGTGLAGAGGDTLRVGAIIPYSGPAALIGGPMEKGAKLIYEELEKTGLAGRKVKFTIYDTEGKVPLAVQQFRRLVDNDEVDVVLGPLTSGEALAISPVANELKVPMITFAASEALTKPPTPYLFSVTPVDSVVINDLLKFFSDQKTKRLGLIYSTDGYGQSGSKILQDRAAEFGLEFVAVETFSPQDTDMSPQLVRIRQKEPDAIVMWTAVNPGSTIILNNAKSLGIKSQFVLSYGSAYNSFRDQAGEAANGIYVIGFPILAPELLADSDPRKPPMLEFTKSYQARWGIAPDSTSGGMLDTKLILEEALKKISGPITREGLRDAIETVKTCGPYGCRQFSSSDHRGNEKGSAILLKVQDGKWVAGTR